MKVNLAVNGLPVGRKGCSASRYVSALLVLAVCLGLYALPLYAQDDTVTVNSAGGANFTTIQAAVDYYISSTPPSGGNLYIDVYGNPTTYSEQVSISNLSWASSTRGMIIREASGQNVTIDGTTYAVRLYSDADYITISGFTMLGTTSNVINIESGCDNNIIQSNSIRIDTSATRGISISSNALTTKVSNNMIYHTANNTNDVRGIEVTSYGNEIYYNSIYMQCTDTVDNDGGVIGWWGSGPLSGFANYALYYNVASGTNYIKNNIFYGYQDGLDTFYDNAYVYLFARNAGSFVSDYNDFARQVVDTGNVYTGYYTTNQQLLSNWQGAANQDWNSLQIDPNFVSTSNLHLTSDSPARGAGIGISGYSTDYDGDSRVTSGGSDMGCDEVPTNGAGAMAGIYDVDDNYGGAYDIPAAPGNGVPDYSNIASAISDIAKRGMSGEVTVNVWSGSYNGFVARNLPATSTDKVYIVEKSGNTATINSGSGSVTYTVRINDSYVVLGGFTINMSGSAVNGIWVDSANNEVYANLISLPFSSTSRGIYLQSSATTTKVNNNMVYHSGIANTSGVRGIEVTSYGNEIYYNSIYMQCTDTVDDDSGGTGWWGAATASGFANYALYYNVASGTNYIKNNIFYGYQSGIGSWDNAYVYLFGRAAGTFVSDYNDFARQVVGSGDVYTGYYAAANQQL